MFQGSFVALVTPMRENGSIDNKALLKLVDWHLEQQTDGIVVTGTTGESPTLTDDEHYQVLTAVVARVNGKIPVIAGTGSNNTQHTIERSRNAKKAGADAALIVTPYYNKPTQEGLYQHFKTTADKVALPIILYNVPSRTCCDLLPDTIKRLSKLPNIFGIKEATNRTERFEEIVKTCRSDFIIYTGNDDSAFDALTHGATGIISVTANLAPKAMHKLCKAVRENDLAKAKSIQDTLSPLHSALFLETSPIPVKWALSDAGLIPNGIRLPLTTLDKKFQADIKSALDKAEINLTADILCE